MQCSECMYAEQAPMTPDNIGQPRPFQCFRFPPTAYPLPGPGGRIMTIAICPTVEPTHRCGEWQGKELS